MNQYEEADLQDLIAYIRQVSGVELVASFYGVYFVLTRCSFIISRIYSQLETDLVKKDDIIAAQDRRIAALEGTDASTINKPTATPDVHSTNGQLYPKNASTPNKSVHVSDDSCETESDDSFTSLGVGLLTRDSQDDEFLGASQSDGRWNIPFDDSSDDDLVPKSSMGKAHPHATALNDICFKPIKDGGVETGISGFADGFAAMSVTPIRPVAIACSLPFRQREISPILETVTRGLSRVDSDGSDKENIDPACSKKLTAETCNLSLRFNSPCR
jgi:hypothetical protein